MAKKLVHMKLDDNLVLDEMNYADSAEKVMRRLSSERNKNNEAFCGLTTTKLRRLYSLVMNIYTKVGTLDDFEEHRTDLQYLKVKMAYEAGRDDSVKAFLSKTGLRELIGRIESYDQFILYCRYAESLVAYFKFYGGKE
ncbi:CRISPR type III-A/MTUBE-associated protein Csm2 [Slackia sp. CM382]|uniref:type III-A CRISPR-associated protein Csm2 n=1 Tax=Slackia sp. CM382 TaxID=1111137 RepID=UPI00027C6622|nr:type III-A CRISPR-associated protein Csm2 [Slackia sp. CM382]EJU35127.1 CRISPR type III-A/MTUBE-associated protein Csm2 [Slackia sp. CM382]